MSSEKNEISEQKNVGIDKSKADAFTGRMLDILNDAALSFMISVGHRTGLYDKMVNLPPSTSQNIADVAGLNERYVREWLGSMVAGKIVEYNPEKGLYHLPLEYAGSLTRNASPNNMAAFAQYMAILGSIEDTIIDRFYNGGGTLYSDYPRFQAVMAEDSGQTVVAALNDYVLPAVPMIVDKLKSGIDVMDIGCGQGRALNLMAKTFPNSRFVGSDISEQSINAAIESAKEMGLKNVKFETKDATDISENEKYDFITTFDAIHDQKKPEQVLKNIINALRSDGIYLMQDIRSSIHVEKNKDHVAGPFIYSVSCFHCMPVSLGAGGPGLGAMWGEERAIEMLHNAGFSNIEVKQLPHDIFNNYIIVRK
jgi:2-polyprenyl-3-methyl-5-hydroxy-6-metoxy-1,4-benzoquinol methylase